MKKQVIPFFLLFALISCQSKEQPSVPRAVNGVLDLRKLDLKKTDVIPLNGEWRFFWHQYPDPLRIDNSGSKEEALYADLPGLWNVKPVGGRIHPGAGWATYSLKVLYNQQDTMLGLYIREISNAYVLYVDDKPLLKKGVIGTDLADYRADKTPAVLYFQPKAGVFRLTLQVCNFRDINGGIIESPVLGSYLKISHFIDYRLAIDFLLFGSILIMGFYHLAIFFLRRKEKDPLYFGLFCLIIALRTLMNGERVVYALFSFLDFETLITLEFFTAYGAVITFLLFFKALYPRELSRLISIPMVYLSLISFVVAVLAPVRILVLYNNYFYNYILLIAAVSLIVGTVLAMIRKREGASIFFLGFLFLFVAVFNDVLFVSNVINTGFILPYGLFLFIFAQSFMLSLRSANAFKTIENYSQRLQETNVSYARFVPKEFLELLGKESIVKVKRGDQIQKEMTVLFCDIRSFTSLSEKMTPRENFNFLNSYLEEITPTIHSNHGFIDKYIGDEVMALFPQKPDDGLLAAIQLRDTIRRYNEKRERAQYPPIDVGIGVHTGPMMLGTIGNEQRLEGTVISDAVNLASRLEGLTKVYGGNTIISSGMILGLKNPYDYQFRFLGVVRVKGKEELLPVYELLDDSQEDTQKVKSQILFEYSVQFYLNKEFGKAEKGFKTLLERNPQDQAAAYYLQLIQHHVENDVQWDIINQITFK